MFTRADLAAVLHTCVEHRIGDGCPCWRCLAHRQALDVANGQTEKNRIYREHLDAVRRRAARSAQRLVKAG